MRELMMISILIGCIPDHIFGLKKDNLICSIFVRYLKTIFTKQCTTLSLVGRRFIFLMCNGLIRDLGGKFRQKRIYLFWAFRSLIFRFFFKTGNHEEHPQLKCSWITASYNSFVNARIRYLLFWYWNFSLVVLFLMIFDANALEINLESSWKLRFSTVSCCLMEYPSKAI